MKRPNLSCDPIALYKYYTNFIQESLKTLINQKFSNVQGVKILIKGRINNASRSNKKIIKIGKISLISQKLPIPFQQPSLWLEVPPLICQSPPFALSDFTGDEFLLRPKTDSKF